MSPANADHRPDGLDAVRDDWQQAVTTPAPQRGHLLQTGELQDTGQRPGNWTEFTGHTTGRGLVTPLRPQKSALTDDDVAHVGHAEQHTAQDSPHDAAEHSRRHRSLADWGHAPLAQ